MAATGPTERVRQVNRKIILFSRKYIYFEGLCDVTLHNENKRVLTVSNSHFHRHNILHNIMRALI